MLMVAGGSPHFQSRNAIDWGCVPHVQTQPDIMLLFVMSEIILQCILHQISTYVYIYIMYVCMYIYIYASMPK